MVDNIAHDLKSPVTRIRISAEMALMDQSSAENNLEMISNTIEECDNMLTIINTMLFISQTDAGTLKEKEELIDLSEMTQKACYLFQAFADENDITLTENIIPHIQIKGNSAMIQRLISNLLENAIKYSYPKSNIDVSINIDESKNKTRLTVKDYGIGISEKDLPNIFKKFYRCDRSRSKPGIGLGLSLCKAIAKSHNGNISVLSELGKGSTFIVSFPYAQ